MEWYADDGSTAGKFAALRAQFERLQQLGPNYGPRYAEHAKVEFAGLNFQAETSSHYLGSVIGEATERDS